MTKELEAKLRQAIQLVQGEEAFIDDEDVDKCLAEIETAFKEAGYFCKWDGSRPGTVILSQDVYLKLKSGQEWYDAFIKALPPEGSNAVWTDTNGHKNPDEWTIKYSDVTKAARKAAGIEG